MNRLSQLLALIAMISCLPVLAEGPDDAYVQIYNQIQAGDRLAGAGQSDAARARYGEALTSLRKLQEGYPNWNGPVIRYRLNYLQEKLGILGSSEPTPKSKSQPPEPVEPAAKAPTPPALDERDKRIAALQTQIKQLEGEKGVLEAKLREALSAQPAAVDPRELTKAEGRIRTMEKDRELLRLALEKAESERKPSADPNEATQLKQALADAQRRLTEQAETVAALTREREILQRKLDEARQRETSTQAARAGTQAPQAQARTAAVPNSEAAAEEAARFKKELADAKTAAESSARLVANLKAEHETLLKTKADLEKRLASSDSRASEVKTLTDRLKKVEQERDGLRAKLEKVSAAEKSSRSSRRENKETAALRSRLASLEATKTPYSPEELALFKPPAATAAKAENKPSTKTASNTPSGVAPLLAEAERAFASRRYAEAEQRYQEVLKADGNNVVTMANLAAAQLEQGRYSEAEATVTRALKLSPEDTHALTLLGILKFRQNDFDEAFDALSRSAQLDPANAETQNYLGITLSQKGQRSAAEAALRKAVQLKPGYASAHHNLAVVYATQKPPFVELARWHYQRALANGHPENPEMEKVLLKQEGK